MTMRQRIVHLVIAWFEGLVIAGAAMHAPELFVALWPPSGESAIAYMREH